MLSILYSELHRLRIALMPCIRMSLAQPAARPFGISNHASPSGRRLLSQWLVFISIAVTSLCSSELRIQWTHAAESSIDQHEANTALPTNPLGLESAHGSSRTEIAFDAMHLATPSRSTLATAEMTLQLPPAVDNDACEIWEISTRHLPDRFGCINTTDPGFDVHRFACGRWLPDSLDRALADDGKLTIVYVHGNFMERNNTLQRVRIVDGYLKPRTQRPYRLILFSWPSQREPRPLRDVLENAKSAECQSLYLAWLLERLGNQPQISLLGFSFGGRTVTGALHLTSGGSIAGLNYQPVTSLDGIQSRYHVGLVAPAVDRYWLAPTGKHRQALDRVESLINIYNTQDPVLRRFRWLDHPSRPVAGGFVGFAGLNHRPVSQHVSTQFDAQPSTLFSVGSPLERPTQVQQFNCSSSVGSTHSERSYYSRCPSFPLILDSLLWNEPIGSCISP
jgi:hypothetical protein